MKAFCIHGHFYQPPRENPITGLIPVEPGSAPYRNWNERIHAECYRPNAELGNFQRLSFNLGPTLFSWMAGYDPQTCTRIIEQDRLNVERYGVGNAMAQAYNHTILPLATRRDKETQIRWGIADFQYRFGRPPKGMWLPETAVDNETLQVLASEGIQHTILAPWQALKEVDTTQPYRIGLPEGNTISVLFYNQDLSTRVSFDPSATVNGDFFLHQLLAPRYRKSYGLDGRPELLLVASDGELYGHHQPFRDKFLSYLLNGALSQAHLSLTYPERWLSDFPAENFTEIQDGTSWSCHHGIRRWCGECGCTQLGRWKAPLRNGLNAIGDLVDRVYEQELAKLNIPDPWELRHRYVEVLLNQRGAADLAQTHARRKLEPDVLRRVELLLTAQYHRQCMFTSCGWFFEDFDRIEPKNNVAHAAQAVWLTSLVHHESLVADAMRALRPVKSWRTGLQADQVFSFHLTRSQAACPRF